jgi:hypothetical protein
MMLLIGALIAWLHLRRHPQFGLPSGSAEANAGHSRVAASLLLAAVGLSALAAALAIAGWFAA